MKRTQNHEARDQNVSASDIRANLNDHHVRSRTQPVAWTGWDLLNGETVPTLTVVLRTRGCYWARRKGCTMCGFVCDSNPSATGPDIYREFLGVLARFGKEFKIIKIFTSGSFLDSEELSPDVRNAILAELKDVPKTIIESRPEFVTDENCEEIARSNAHVEIAIGLESSNDYIRERYINKGFTFRDFIRASKAARSSGFTVKSYLLLKPPFLTEAEAMRDTIQSVKDTTEYADIISLNLCNVQRGTFVEKLWKKRLYRPPWLWTAVEVLTQTAGNMPIICDPVAGGMRRGPHNCGICDHEIVAEIRRFSLSQDKASFKTTCADKVLWNFVLEFEEYSYGAPLVP
ncbi:MAG: archaeosine biosynthesis radical SAM protein RaSEA [Euryarchaeota archaeon]|nr:archaeosine biosynthesis radical SAM protein RaSEA [Euryarchaeota archaeon]